MVELKYGMDSIPVKNNLIYEFDPPRHIDLIRMAIAKRCQLGKTKSDKQVKQEEMEWYGLPSPPVDDKGADAPFPMASTSLPQSPELHSTAHALTQEDIERKLEQLRAEKHQLFQMIKQLLLQESEEKRRKKWMEEEQRRVKEQEQKQKQELEQQRQWEKQQKQQKQPKLQQEQYWQQEGLWRLSQTTPSSMQVSPMPYDGRNAQARQPAAYPHSPHRHRPPSGKPSPSTSPRRVSPTASQHDQHYPRSHRSYF